MLAIARRNGMRLSLDWSALAGGMLLVGREKGGRMEGWEGDDIGWEGPGVSSSVR